MGRVAAELLRLPVRLNDIVLGRPVDLLVDLEAGRAIGIDVLCRDEVHRFLPLGATQVRDDAIAVGSPLTLLEEAELRFYRDRGTTLTQLRGADVDRDGAPAGRLRDLELAADGRIEAFLVEHGGVVRALAPASGVHVRARSAA